MTRKELIDQIKKKQSYLCVGLDTDIAKIPKHLLSAEDPVFEFNRRIIEATADFAIAFKPNLAFYESLGPKGLSSLEKTVKAIPENVFSIADAKRGDIGNTSDMYAKTFFDYYGFDSVTVAPYMGKDSVMPFLDHPGKWVILLALTSNAGSLDFQLQEIKVPGQPDIHLYQQVIRHSRQWGNQDQLMFVVGATHPDLFTSVRKFAPDNFLLVPGVGAQGGNLAEISKAGFNKDVGLIVNSSRQIIYASNGEDFADAARKEAEKLQQEMSQLMESLL